MENTQPVQLFASRRQRPSLSAVPQTQTLFIGAKECVRHCSRRSLTEESRAALCLPDSEIVLGNTEPLIIEAIQQLYNQAKDKPRGFFLYTGCPMRFIGVDFEGVTQTLQTLLPLQVSHIEQISFMAARQSGGLASMFSKAIYQLLPKGQSDKSTGVFLLNGSAPFAPENELLHYFKSNQIPLLLANKWQDFDDFLKVGNASLILVTDGDLLEAAECLKERRGIDYLYLPLSYRREEIANAYSMLDQKFAKKTDMHEFFYQPQNNSYTRLDLDLRSAMRPWSLSRALLEYGFPVTSIIASKRLRMDEDDHSEVQVVLEEDPDYQWLKQNHPKLPIQIESQSHSHHQGRQGLANGHREGRHDHHGDFNRPQGQTFGEQSYWGYAALKNLAEQLNIRRIGS